MASANQSVMANRGTVANANIKLDAGNEADVKLWSTGRFDCYGLDADIFSTKGTGSITVDISGGGTFGWIDLFANIPANTNPSPSTLLSLLVQRARTCFASGAWPPELREPGKVYVTNALQSRLQVDTLTTSGNTRFKNDGTLTASNLTVEGSSTFVQSGTAYVASAWFRGASQSQINGPTAITNLTLEGNVFMQHNTNMHGSTMQINATNGSNLGFQNNGLLPIRHASHDREQPGQ